jgi:ppGpp synthetase/RelA/SpoT-type nucleotidyltranferase
MKKRQKEAILVAFLKEKEKYEQLAEYIFHLIRDDPSSPKESLHTIMYRIKNEARLLEKIDEDNKQAGHETAPITKDDFQERIGDLLGIRLICLRLSDINKVEAYLGFLADEKILRFIDKPDQKRSFVLPVDPGEAIPTGLDLGYSGYSSIHYQIKLGENSDAIDELKDLQIEFQLRTILEEAWGEIDHKYRYMLSRSGNELPEYIHTGFYNLSAYLQAAALQAEHLCRQAEAYRQPKTRRARGKPATPIASEPGSYEKSMDNTDPRNSLLALRGVVEKVFGFEPPVRTLTYILKRMDGLGQAEKPQVLFRRVLSKDRLKEFRTVFHEVLGREAFQDKRKRNVDAINAVNYAMFDEIHGKTVAQEGLRSVLRWRKQDSLRRE